jgi:multidrug efflux pump subunit AcrA (membrane-fusion protein)
MSSSEQSSLDPALIEQTKQQIRSLVGEIAQLSRSEIAPAQFYGEFLTRVVSALAAAGGAVWTLNEEGRLGLQYQINLQETGLAGDEAGQMQHARLLYRVLRGGEPAMVPPHSGGGADDDEGSNPTGFLLVLGLLKTDVETTGLVEVFQRSDASLATQKGYLRFLTQMCELGGDFLRNYQLRHFSDRQVLWTQLEEFTRVVHGSLDSKQTAYTIANEGRRLVGCDRLSVAIRRRGKCSIEAVSGQDVVDKRSNTVRLLGRLATAVAATGEPVWYTGDTRDMAPQVEEAVQAYIDESHSKMVAVLPLARPRPVEEEDAEKTEELEPVFGALVVEQIEDSRVSPTVAGRVEVVARHSAAALGNAMEHESLFLMPLWRALGKSRWVVQARTLPKTLAVCGAAVVLLLVLLLWPAKFKLESKGSLEPVTRSDVFARIDGVVEELLVEHGRAVRKDDVLLRLRNTDLDVALTEVSGQILATRERIMAVERMLLERRDLDPAERHRLEGEMAEQRERLVSLEAQQRLYRLKRQDLEVRSPIDGVVVTWDLENRLDRRPVQRGQVLMRVADPAKDWEVELLMPERRMGHVVAALEAADARGEALRVEYQLATEPGRTYTGSVRDVHLAAEVRGEEGNTVLVGVTIPPETLETLRTQLRPGATVNAKVDCGRRSLGYVLFHDLIAFVRSRILFRYL